MTREQQVDAVVRIPWVGVSDTRRVYVDYMEPIQQRGVRGTHAHGYVYRIPECGQGHRVGLRVHRCTQWCVLTVACTGL